jgi:GntR family transcriptional regulator, transcriptional repressor for pyruvate dehydrogenase complex
MNRPKSGLATQVADWFLQAIVAGDYPPGSKLPIEAELAAMADISRITLREAIRILQVKGVVRVEHGRGMFVNPMEAWSALDPSVLAARASAGGERITISKKLLEARWLVEVGVAQLAARRRSAQDVADLEAAIETMRQANAAGRNDDFVDADIRFHQVIMHAAGNELVAALFEPIEQLVYEGRRETSQWQVARRHAIAAHQRILDALRAEDPEAARQAMEAHLIQTGVDLDRATGRRGGPRKR